MAEVWRFMKFTFLVKFRLCEFQMVDGGLLLVMLFSLRRGVCGVLSTGGVL